MCVEEVELSAYLDGELSAERVKEVESHVAVCEECKERLADLRKMESAFRSAALSNVEVEERKERSLQRVKVGLQRSPEPPLWKKRVSLSMPFAAAATLFVFFLGGIITLLTGIGGFISEKSPQIAAPLENTFTTSESSVDSASIETIQKNSGSERKTPTREEMEEFIRFMSERGASMEIRIELPDPSSFTIHGEPQLMRAADYHGLEESTAN